MKDKTSLAVTLHSIAPVPGSRRRPVRLGMGEGSGTGQTATRGQKGQRSRSGDGKMSGFEGGQTPLLRRIPKRGFTNGPFRRRFQVVSLAAIGKTFRNQREVDLDALRIHGLVKGRLPVKVLGDGALEGAFKISAHAFSAGARDKIQKAGGEAVVLKP
ncbi:MAG: 50S ribosomal protein L15 [Elusimicrobia bacterium]|nr:50S ribosomal protein L15 [Elusimicrobiota bacterium]